MQQKKKVAIEWVLQPRQIEFVRACGLAYALDYSSPGPTPPKARVIMYAGSAGAGKTDGLLMIGFLAALTWPGCQIGYFRRNFPHLSGPGGAITRSQQMYSQLGKYNSTEHRWTFYNKSVLQFCHCKDESSVHDYMSQQFDVLLIDESTQFTVYQLRYLLSRNRATVNNLIPFCAIATNPGGVSHGYHKKMFVEAGPPGEPVEVEVEPGYYEKHIFIPARLEDNIVLEERDPGYRKTLERMPEATRKALLEGSWEIYEGQYFPEFSKEKHVVKPFKIPEHYRKFGSMDWGYRAPCAVHLHAIDPADGRIYTYKELYFTETRAADAAQMVKEMIGDHEIAYFKVSPDMWQERGLGSKASPGEVVAEEFIKAGINIEPADNRRILGWQRMREYLSDAPDGKPYWQIFENCYNLIRTLPELIYDDKKVEDVSKNCEDHACLVKGTLITTERGEVPIERVRPKDKVLTRKGYREVEKVWLTGIKPVFSFELENGNTLTGTADHPVWVDGKGFIPLKDVSTESQLITGSGVNCNQGVSSYPKYAGVKPVYNLKVSGVPEYFANGVLVHNCESARYFLFSRPSPLDGSSFLPGAAEHYLDPNSDSFDEDDDFQDMVDTDGVSNFYGM